MTVEETGLKDCLIIEPSIFTDNRGYFFESFNKEVFEKSTGQSADFVQDNQSYSQYGVIRGLHYQTGKYEQAKLMRVISGKVLDVAVDLRRDSSTYCQWKSVILSAENHLQLYIPRGFAHGFSVLEENTVFAYKCDQYYHKPAECGIRFDDPSLNIDWGIPAKDRILSEKDMNLLFFENVQS